MINLMSPDQKRDIRAARTNVFLVQYGVMLVALGLLVGLTYAIGFWLVMQDKKVISEKLQSQSEQAKTFTAVEKEADAFRKNLTVAKQILNNETSYSTFLTTLASDMPSGTILTSFTVGGATTPAAQNGMTLDARTTSYGKALELKTKLEQSVLFEDVSIVSATRPDDIAGLSGLNAKYPYEVSYNVKLSVKKPGATQ